jgi:hypothetical protein
VKLVLFVEGHTERALPAFFKRWLDACLPQPVGVRAVRFTGWRDYYDEIATKVDLNLSGKAGADVVAGIGLLDLYGPDFYPKSAATPADRYSWAKKHLEDKVGHSRFRQHFAVHETEAWLLAAPEILPREVRTALPPRSARPEEVNFDEPPAKLLARLYQEKLSRSYKKVIDGGDLFRTLPPEQAVEKCPNLKVLLNEMLELVQNEG